MTKLLHTIKPWRPGRVDVLSAPFCAGIAFVWTVISNLLSYNDLLLSLPGSTGWQIFLYWLLFFVTLWLILDLLVWLTVAAYRALHGKGWM